MIETARLVLRTPRLEDAPGLTFLRDPEVMRFVGGVEPAPVEEIVQRWLDRWEANGLRSIGVVDRLGCEPVALVATVHGPAIVWEHPR